MFWHALWKSCGSPTAGVVAAVQKSTRVRYHHAIRFFKHTDELACFSVMGEHFINEQRKDFWTEVKEMRGCEHSGATLADGGNTEADIADIFSCKYHALYNSVGFHPHMMEALQDEIDHKVHEHHDSCYSHVITPNELCTAIRDLKAGKHDGHWGQ